MLPYSPHQGMLILVSMNFGTQNILEGKINMLRIYKSGELTTFLYIVSSYQLEYCVSVLHSFRNLSSKLKLQMTCNSNQSLGNVIYSG